MATKKLIVPGEGKPKKKKGAPGNLTRGRKQTQLTPKMAAFCVEFMLDKNSTKAAQRAGYNTRTSHSTGFKLLRHPMVKAELARLQEEIMEDYVVTHQMITNELYRIAFSDTNNYVEIIETGEGKDKEQSVIFKPTSALKKGNGKVIESIEIGRRGVKLKLHNKNQALDMLAKHVGYFGVDNKQKTPNGVLMYIPDNGRGDVVAAEEDEEIKK